MSDTSPILSLPLIQPAQAQKHVTHNEALRLLDVLVQLAVADRDRTAPPTGATEGQRHIVAAGATGDWAGQDDKIAFLENGAWSFVDPMAGWRAEVLAEGIAIVFDGTAWAPVQPALDNLDGVGIGTSADAINRLAVASEASLLSHAGAGHQLKVNKSATTDTASLLFQVNWSGRAEMGLAGNDNWSIKVSPDGTAWTEAMAFDAVTGHASGAAVQATPDDVTPGRLMRADYGYGPGNLLGVVSQSGGAPTGAVIEAGTTGSGEYTRFADGTQICQHKVTLTLNSYNNVTTNWTFPKSFASTPHVIMSASNSGSDYINCGAAQFGLQRQGSGASSVGLTITGIETLSAGAEMRDVRVTAIGRWF